MTAETYQDDTNRHDPLCPWGQAFDHLEPWEPQHYCCQDCNPGMTDPDTVTCQCDLIAKVEARCTPNHFRKGIEQLIVKANRWRDENAELRKQLELERASERGAHKVWIVT